MKPALKYVIGGALILLGTVLLCLFSVNGQDILEIIAILGVGCGWYLVIYQAANALAISSTNRFRYLRQVILSPRGIRTIAFILIIINVSICLAISDKIVSYVLDSLPTKVTNARVTAVDEAPSTRHNSYEVKFQYVNNSDTITQIIHTRNYSSYWIGRPILIRYSLVYPDVYKVIQLQ